MDLDCRVLCHGDDFCVLGDVEAIKNFEEMLSKKNVYKLSALLRFESSDDRTGSIAQQGSECRDGNASAWD